MNRDGLLGPEKIPAIKVRQWLNDWEKISFKLEEHRRRPQPYFFLFTLAASRLKALTGIYRRQTGDDTPRILDLGVQRRHEVKRSEEISRFVRFGYPWSTLSERRRKSEEFNDLRKPGWLPTAIVVNILGPGDSRDGNEVAEEDLVTLNDNGDSLATITLPEGSTSPGWRPRQIHPIEVIDGQHRLWAFEDSDITDFDLPIVAFHGLDISWQAYLFWTINVKPTRINRSLAYDLYPLLRTEDWLDRAEGLPIYRETRAQELTETLWAHPQSPWYQRINMLGEPGTRSVTQGSWIQALMASYVKRWEGPGIRIGGLFGAPTGSSEVALPWSRAQQAAFLIVVWQRLRDAIGESSAEWATVLRDTEGQRRRKGRDPAFEGSLSLLNTDQGVRGVLFVTNDLCFVRADSLELRNWVLDQDVGAVDEPAVTNAIDSLRDQPSAIAYVDAIVASFATFDWRTMAAPGLTDDQKTIKAAFRGTGGYRQLRRRLLLHLFDGPKEISEPARDVFDTLGFE